MPRDDLRDDFALFARLVREERSAGNVTDGEVDFGGALDEDIVEIPADVGGRPVVGGEGGPRDFRRDGAGEQLLLNV